MIGLMKRIKAQARVYREFFTGGSIAWFSAGIIAPFFTQEITLKGIIGSIVSLNACFVFLKWASLFAEEEL